MSMPSVTPNGVGKISSVSAIVLINFVLLGSCLLPATRDALGQVFQALKHYPPLPWLFDLWVVGFTFFATGLFIRKMVKAWRVAEASRSRTSALVVDAAFLLCWWIALLVIIAWALMLGTGVL